MGWLRALFHQTRATGAAGEGLAEQWLKRKGFIIEGRNVRVGRDEIDLIATDPADNALVIAEVKSRSNFTVSAEAAVDRRKQHRMSRAAARLLQRKRYAGRRVRFDVVIVDLADADNPTVRHYTGAFDSTI